MRQLMQRAQFRLAPADAAAPALPDVSPYLTAATLSEFDSKSLLPRPASHAGGILVTDKPGLDDAVSRTGFPLVMKIQSRRSPAQERSRRRALNIASRDDALAAFDALLESAHRHRPDRRSRRAGQPDGQKRG